MVRIANVVMALPVLASARLNEDTSLPTCPPPGFSTVTNFDLAAFVDGRWWIQQQQPVPYLPASENRCVYAEYTEFATPTLLGYNIQVNNHAEDVAPPYTVHDTGSGICAKIVDASAGKLEVAPCFIPSFGAGPYWVVAVDESQGYALISGGAPTIAATGGCQTSSSVTDGSGLWIFTRTQQASASLVQQVRDIAQAKGFDLSVLNSIDNSNCTAPTMRPPTAVEV